MKIEDHLIKMRGGNLYAPVYVRIALFRQDHPVSDGWGINAEIISTDEVSCLARAEIVDPNGRVVATGHKREHKAHFPDYEEKSLTGAVGRALLMSGYGTQYALDELNEGERIVDAPIPAPGTMKMTVSATVTKVDTKLEYKIAATNFMGECKRILGSDITPADAKSVYNRMFGTDTMTTDNLQTAITRMNEYSDLEADRFTEDLLEDDD
jgi:hypothetical protein